MEPDEFDDEAFFRALQESGTRGLVIGRKALVLLGSPVITADYDLWIHIDDVEKLNAACEPLGLFPNHPPDAARARGRYVLENGERVDVMVARSKAAPDGDGLGFEEAWSRRRRVAIGPGIAVHVPSIEDLIVTKRWASRAKDLVDIQFLEVLLARERGGKA